MEEENSNESGLIESDVEELENLINKTEFHLGEKEVAHDQQCGETKDISSETINEYNTEKPDNDCKNLIDNVENSLESINDKPDSCLKDISDMNSTFISSPDNFENSEENELLYDVSNIKENGNEEVSKRKNDEGLELRDELDFEEEKESGEEDSEDERKTKKPPVHREEGELSDEDEEDGLLRQEPKTVCRFFNKGQCTWGTNCRFLHPGVSDKGNYNMFAAPKPPSQPDKEEAEAGKERPQDVRPFVPEPVGYESAWERGLRHAKEMMKRANKRKETDADFEEKRFNLSLGQAELDRENDYYTRPASPVYKTTDEVVDYLDPFEKQAIRHFRGGHFENFEVRYKVGSTYPGRGDPHGMRSRRGKFERQVAERMPRRMRPGSPHTDDHKVKEKRYPRPRVWKEERGNEPAPPPMLKEAESWADPWARGRSPTEKSKKKMPRRRSYSSGSSSKSSGSSSRSSSYSGSSGSRSSSRSRRSSRSNSRSITPPVHPRQQKATMNNRGGRGFRGRGRGGYGQPRYPYQQPYSQPPNPPPNHPLAPNVAFGNRPNMPPMDINRRGNNMRDGRMNLPMRQDSRNIGKDLRERITFPAKIESKSAPNEQLGRTQIQRINPRVQVPAPNERVDMFGRTIRKELPKSPPRKSRSKTPVKAHGRRKFSLSPSGSSSGSGSGSRSRSFSRSHSRSRSGSGSSSSITPPPSPAPKKKVDKIRRMAPGGTVSYGETTKAKAIDLAKVAGHKQQIKLTLKKPGVASKQDKPVVDVDEDSGESDTDARILKKRKMESPPPKPLPTKVAKPRVPSPTVLASLTTGGVGGAKKPSAARREELLKQLRAVEDAIAKKRSK